MNINNNLLSHKDLVTEYGILYIVGTPIGNLGDISFRAIKTLQEVNIIACEDTRNTRKIINKYKINTALISFNKDNSFKKIPKLIKDLNSGKSIALVSDAGMPGICDPGDELVREVKKNNLNIICIPGPCAATTALVKSGFNSSKFIFEGFLPRKKIEREKVIKNICSSEFTIIVYESPHRLKKLLISLSEICGEEREIEIFRELTKKFEENIGSNLKQVLDHFKKNEPKGEFTIVIKGIKHENKVSFNEQNLKRELNELIHAGLSLSAASKYLAKKNKLKKNVIYNLFKYN